MTINSNESFDLTSQKPDTSWFKKCGFGLFMHWGPYALAEGRWKGLEHEMDLWAEWLMCRADISVSEYEAMARNFKPKNFNPQDWAELVEESGAKYVLLTAKHHDGFALYPSKVSKYNSVDWPTGNGRDLVSELRDAVRKKGLRYGVYYSQKIDWYHHALNLRKAEVFTNDCKTETTDMWSHYGDPKSFMEYFNTICIPQVTEILDRYNPLDVLWFDIGVLEPEAKRLLTLIRKMQPNCLINSRLCRSEFESDYKGGGDNEITPVTLPAPWESCMTMNYHWGDYPQDIFHHSAKEVIRMLVEIRSKGGNLLLNIAPDKNGNIRPRDRSVLRKVGAWLRRFGESIYEVEASPCARVPWGHITKGKNGKLYLHMQELPSRGELVVPGIMGQIKNAWFLGDELKKSLSMRKLGHTDHAIRIPVESAPLEAMDDSNTVIVLEIGAEPRFESTYLLHSDHVNIFTPGLSKCFGEAKIFNTRYPYLDEDDGSLEKNIYYNTVEITGRGSCEWTFRTIEAGDYFLVVEYKYSENPGRQLDVTINEDKFIAHLQPTRPDEISQCKEVYNYSIVTYLHKPEFTSIRIGTVHLPKIDQYTMRVTLAENLSKSPMIIRELRLIPTRMTPLKESQHRFK